MSLLLKYFSATSDQAAATTIDRGPQSDPTLHVVDGRGVEPTVQLGMFEELLTGKSFDEQLDDPQSRPIVSDRDGGELLVVRLDDNFVAQLAAATVEQLSRLVEPWSETEEFCGQASAEGLTELIVQLRGLAEHAVAAGEHVYCWMCF